MKLILMYSSKYEQLRIMKLSCNCIKCLESNNKARLLVN